MISSLRLGCFWLQEVLQLKHQLIKLINWFKFFNLVAEFRLLQNSMGEFNLASSQKIQSIDGEIEIDRYKMEEFSKQPFFDGRRFTARSWSHDGERFSGSDDFPDVISGGPKKLLRWFSAVNFSEVPGV